MFRLIPVDQSDNSKALQYLWESVLIHPFETATISTTRRTAPVIHEIREEAPSELRSFGFRTEGGGGRGGGGGK